MRRQLRLAIVLALIMFFALIVVQFSNRPLTFVQIDQPQHGGAYICIFGNLSVGQIFLSKARNLEAVEVFLGPIPSNNVNVIFHLREARQDIRTVTVNTSDFIFNQYYRFNFPEVSDSDGKQFSFLVESPNSMFSDPLCISYVVENFVNRQNVYSDGSAFTNGTQIRGVLSFRVLSETTLSEAFTSLYGRASKDAAFFAAYLLMLAALSVIFVKVTRSGAQDRFFSKRASDRNLALESQRMYKMIEQSAIRRYI